MIDAEGALVCTEQPSFHESRNAVNAREHVVCIPTRTLDRCASMHIVVSCRQRIGGQSVGKYLGAGFDITRKEGAQCVGLSIGDDLNAATAEPFWLNLLDGHSNQYLARSASSSFPRASATQHRFIDFHIARKSRALGVSNGTTKSVQHRPSRFVGAKPHETMERLGRNPVLRRRHVPCARKPNSEGRFRAMKDCAGRCRNPPTATFTPPSAIIHAPSRTVSTVRTGKSVRPTQPIQVIDTSGIIRKPAEKIRIISRVVLSSLRLGLRSSCGHRGMLTSPHSSGYPTCGFPSGSIWSDQAMSITDPL